MHIYNSQFIIKQNHISNMRSLLIITTIGIIFFSCSSKMDYRDNNFIKSIEKDILEMTMEEVIKIEIIHEFVDQVVITDKKLINDFFDTVKIYEHNSNCGMEETSLGFTMDDITMCNSIRVIGYSYEKSDTIQRKYLFCKDYQGNIDSFIDELK